MPFSLSEKPSHLLLIEEVASGGWMLQSAALRSVRFIGVGLGGEFMN
jgi:hypothetical protein